MAWQSPADFYNSVYDRAIALGATDTQARLAAAQASQETGFGQHYVGNNLFGVKASDDYTGATVDAATGEEIGGQNVTINDRFRAFEDPLDSVGNYLGVVQSNFPDAFAGENFSDAAKGLNTGVYGKYATDSGYGRKINAIDAKYGPYAYANIENAPVPYSPGFAPIELGLPDDVIPVDDPNFAPASTQFAYAEDPANVPAPQSRPNIPTGGMLTAFQANPDYKSPFDAVMAPVEQQPANWGLNPDVAPALVPTVNSWAPVAAAEPITAPMDVTATGLLAGTPSLAADARANPMMSLAAEGLLGANPGLSANATVSGLPEVASASSRMGIADPGFDQSRFDGGTVSVANDFDQSRFASPAAAFDASRFGPGLIDVATNTQSFADQSSTPTAAANLGNFADAYSAQRGPSTGVNSAEMSTRLADIQRQLLDPASQAPMVQQQTAMMDVPAAGLLAGNAPLAAETVANVPAQTVQTPPVDNAVTGSVTPGLLSPTSIATANVPMSFTAPTGILAGQPIQQNAFVDSFPSSVANNTIEPATVNDVVAAPTLDTIQVSEQPTISSQMATVEGPATTPALDQQEQAQITAPSTTTAARTTPTQTTTQNRGLLSGLLSKETALGGLLGGLALGPAGGLLGALAGQQVARNGGLGSMFSPTSFSAPTNQIAGGMNNISGIYGGLFSPGTYAVANNGTTITAQPGGYVTTTNSFGVTEAVGPDGKISSYFGGNANPDQDTESSGGFFGGLFG